ncbi:RNA polymerase II mediator complex subunit [Blastocladiella emersonii ATCC 22665]|nr:RNA polymerase II mediator complex subunit [Blastocladiella emersonii ATCC 22665]
MADRHAPTASRLLRDPLASTTTPLQHPAPTSQRPLGSVAAALAAQAPPAHHQGTAPPAWSAALPNGSFSSAPPPHAAPAPESPTYSPDADAIDPALAVVQAALASLTDVAREVLHFEDESRPALAAHLAAFTAHMADLDALAQYPAGDSATGATQQPPPPLSTVWIPARVLELVDRGENPHRATSEVMERVAGENQFTHGKVDAAARLRDAMAAELASVFPDGFLDEVDAGAAGAPGPSTAPPPAPLPQFSSQQSSQTQSQQSQQSGGAGAGALPSPRSMNVPPHSASASQATESQQL